MVKRVGILTAGGDAPGLNAAIRGFGRAAVGEYGLELIGFLDGIRGLAENRFVTLDSSSLSGILTQGGTVLGTSRDKVHRMQVGESEKDMSEKILKVYEKNKLDAIVTLGGGGTAKNALRLQKAGINVVHLPKTIDNDIWGTDNSIGFATALEIATEAIDRLHSTAHSHHRIILVEIMGHRAGWLALGAGIAGGADIILIPEIPYNIEKVVEKIEHRKKLGKHFSVIAVAEGAMDVEYAQRIRIADQLIKDADSPETKALAKHNKDRLTDAHREATFDLARKLETMTGLESRVTILGYVQRGGTPVGADRLLATRLGAAGAAAVADGITGVMIATKGENAVNVPLEKIAGKVKFVPTDHEWVKTAREVETGLGD
ncbi:ATP-dependent 6-phosphofructokinase [Mobiluncus mulieris]|uniref:ATP-dependent 6-phosphofructokinase n=1 Tax=Mobiluncus mulieris TaxID=2052 RepID=A0A7Y0U0N8_9ACTO|nr:ATP-dependent 6-phosphofructokinase [Mobiluncus mulieris]NMW64719.1 ATP-dependent 6-phosphofructokinase [Mobiluncus mulieris]